MINKVIIAGGRNITNYKYLEEAIADSNFRIDEVVCGEARGVDKMGRIWAEKHEVPIMSMPACWDVYGKSAGYIRNSQMGNYGTHLILIWDGKSKGSASMLKIAKEKGLMIFEKIVE